MKQSFMKTPTKKRKTITNNNLPAERNGLRPGRTPPATEAHSAFEIKSILVPTDFSFESQKALAHAVRLGHQFGAKLTMLHVVEPVATPDFGLSLPLILDEERLKAACRHRFERLTKDSKTGPKIIEKTLVRHGRAFNEIVHAAKSLKVDLIVISTHGYTGLKRAFLGSTAERVVRHASCPVLVVR
jgi:universal stress protein A